MDSEWQIVYSFLDIKSHLNLSRVNKQGNELLAWRKLIRVNLTKLTELGLSNEQIENTESLQNLSEFILSGS